MIPRSSVQLTENYTLHPHILQIANTILYASHLTPCGNLHKLSQFDNWRGLRVRGFPVVVHHTTGNSLINLVS